MHFIDQVDLKATARRGVLHVVQQIARVFDFSARRGVDFNQIDKAALFDFTAVVAYATWRGGNAGFAIEPFGQQTRNSGLSDAAGAGKR